jgi:hypothetical protein
MVKTHRNLCSEEKGFINGLIKVGLSYTAIIDIFRKNYNRKIGPSTIYRIKYPVSHVNAKRGPKFKLSNRQIITQKK